VSFCFWFCLDAIYAFASMVRRYSIDGFCNTINRRVLLSILQRDKG